MEGNKNKVIQLSMKMSRMSISVPKIPFQCTKLSAETEIPCLMHQLIQISELKELTIITEFMQPIYNQFRQYDLLVLLSFYKSILIPLKLTHDIQ